MGNSSERNGVLLKPDLIDTLEIELWRVIELAHRSGLSYWEILREVNKLSNVIMEMADIEYHLKGGV